VVVTQQPPNPVQVCLFVIVCFAKLVTIIFKNCKDYLKTLSTRCTLYESAFFPAHYAILPQTTGVTFKQAMAELYFSIENSHLIWLLIRFSLKTIYCNSQVGRRASTFDFRSRSSWFLCPRHSKNGGGALSVTPVRACVRPSVRQKFGVRLITFERLHRFNSILYVDI